MKFLSQNTVSSHLNAFLWFALFPVTKQTYRGFTHRIR